MISEHDRIVLHGDLPESGLLAGDVGTIIHVHDQGKAFEVEFMALDGETVAIVTLEAARVRPVQHREITHARSLAVA